MQTRRFISAVAAHTVRILAVGALLLAANPAQAQVRRVTLGLHTTCPYGLVA